jgi:hypothetical protein
VADRLADGVLVEDVRAVDQVAVAGVQLVRAQCVRHAPLLGAERRHEDLAVEDDLHAGGKA